MHAFNSVPESQCALMSTIVLRGCHIYKISLFSLHLLLCMNVILDAFVWDSPSHEEQRKNQNENICHINSEVLSQVCSFRSYPSPHRSPRPHMVPGVVGGLERGSAG